VDLSLVVGHSAGFVWFGGNAEASQPGDLFLRMWARVVGDQNLSGFGQITVDVMGCWSSA
jgi:hypothetical protein